MPRKFRNGLKRATKTVNTALNTIAGRLGLDHARVLFGRFAIPVMARYLDQRNGPLDERERDKLLFWYFQAGMRGRFSGSVESKIDQDLALIEEIEGGLDRLIEQLRLGYGGLRVEPGHFDEWSLGARFYPVLYMLTRMGEARDWGALACHSGLICWVANEQAGGPSHFSEITALCSRLQAARGQCLGQFLFSDQGHQSFHQQPSARGIFSRDRRKTRGRLAVAMDSNGPGALADRELSGLS